MGRVEGGDFLRQGGMGVAVNKVGFKSWLAALVLEELGIREYSWKGFVEDELEESLEVQQFVHSLGSLDKACFEGGTRLTLDQRQNLLYEMGEEGVRSMGLEFPDDDIGLRGPEWAMPYEERPRFDDYKHSFRLQNLLMDGWHLLPPIVLDWLVASIRWGVNVNYTGLRQGSKRTSNHPSVLDDPAAVVAELALEQKEGRRPPWTPSPPFKWFVQAPVGRAPKTKVVVKDGIFSLQESLRVIMDWSAGSVKRQLGDKAAPDSLNAQIPLMDIKFISFDTMLLCFLEAGKDAWITVFDFAHAHQSVSVREADWPLGIISLAELGWSICARLQYGSRRSAGVWEIFGEIFTVLLAAKWGIVGVLRWVDDLCHFARSKEEAMRVQALVVYVSQRYGFKLHPGKILGPLQIAKFLGLLWNPSAGTLSFPAEKIFKYLSFLEGLQQEARWSLDDLRSATGIIVYLAMVFVPLRFMGPLWSAQIKSMENMVPILNSCKPPIGLSWHVRVVSTVLRLHSGSAVAFIHSCMKDRGTGVSAQVERTIVEVDASGDFGWGAYMPLTKAWSGFDWCPREKDSHLAETHFSSPLFEAKGMVYALWSLQLKNQNVLFKSDAEVVVDKYRFPHRRFQKNAAMNSVMFALCVSECVLNVCVSLIHIPGVQNVFADAISRGSQGRLNLEELARVQGWSPSDSWRPPISPPVGISQETPLLFWSVR